MEAYPIIITIILGTAVSIGYSNPVQPNAFQPDYSHIPQCMQPHESGMCLAYFPSWYYHPEDGTCKEFIYGGCGGNSNRFFSFDECMKACEGFKPTIDKDFKLKEEEDSAEDICKQVSETGPCRAMLPRFYFNESGGKCEVFMWGGCEGNKNNFVSIEACQEKCGPKSSEESKETAEESKEPEGESEVESESNESSEEAAKNE